MYLTITYNIKKPLYINFGLNLTPDFSKLVNSLENKLFDWLIGKNI